jgi:cobalt-precorrin 5A hydrolase
MNIWIVAFTTAGCVTAERIAGALNGNDVSLYAKSTSDERGLMHIQGSLRNWAGEAFKSADAVVFIGAAGIAVRAIAAFVKSKDSDPAVIVVDEKGMFTIPLLSGHIGGSNALAEMIAAGIHSTPVVTTATDINGKISIDSFAVTHGMALEGLPAAKEISARVLDGRFVGFISDLPLNGPMPKELTLVGSGEIGVLISEKAGRPFGTTLRLVPRNYTMGIGCRRGIQIGNIKALVSKVLDEEGLSLLNIRTIASIDLKKDEPALLQYCDSNGIPAVFFSAGELKAIPGDYFTKSAFVKSITGVDNVCERSAIAASKGGKLVRRKESADGVTVALAREDFVVDFTGGPI